MKFQRLVVDHLHILGDIYDRGPAPHFIMDRLMQYHSLDIQWGNHDVVWMGAAAGQRGCITNVIRICARYGNLDILEDGYGINLLPLANFALRIYGDDPCTCFRRKGSERLQKAEMEMNLRMHKAISVIQFKVEGKLILQVHDELIVECPQSEGEQVARILEEEMERVVSLSVPLLAEAHVGRSWADAH